MGGDQKEVEGDNPEERRDDRRLEAEPDRRQHDRQEIEHDHVGRGE